MAGIHRLHAQPGGQAWQLINGGAVAADQAHRRGACHPVRFGQGAQFRVQHRQAVAQKLHPPIGTRQGVEDGGVEDEGAPDAARAFQRLVQRGVVVHAQVPAQPDQGAGEPAFRWGFVHVWKCRAE